MAKNKKETTEQDETTEQTGTPEVLKPTSITAKPRKPAGERLASNGAKVERHIFYTLGREVTKDDKMASQCSVVYQHICVLCAEYGKADRQKLIDSITPGVGGELRTKQGVDRIVAYYIPYLVKAGLINKSTESTESTEVKTAELVEQAPAQ